MYAVVGCNECHALWVVEGRQESAGCPRCGKRHQFRKLKQFVTTDDENHAREVRASMLAARQGEDDAFAELDSFAEMERRVDEDVVSDAEYLRESGLDPDEVRAAGEATPDRSLSRRERVLRAVETLDAPTTDDVVARCAEHGIDGEDVREALRKLTRAGELTESGGTYRRL